MPGYENTIAVREDGSVVSVGGYWTGVNVSDWRNVKVVAAGSDYTLARKEDGTFVADGLNGWFIQSQISMWTDVRYIASAYGQLV